MDVKFRDERREVSFWVSDSIAELLLGALVFFVGAILGKGGGRS